jgi:hypothetical protein
MIVVSLLLCGVVFIIFGSVSRWLGLLKARDTAAAT